MRKLLSNFFKWLHNTRQTYTRSFLTWCNNAEIRQVAKQVQELDREELLGCYARGAANPVDTIKPDVLIARLSQAGANVLAGDRVTGEIYVKPSRFPGLTPRDVKRILHLPKSVNLILDDPPSPED